MKITDLKRIDGVKKWLCKKKADEVKYFYKALRSKTGIKLGFGRRLTEYFSDHNRCMDGLNTLDTIFKSYQGPDRPDVKMFVEDVMDKLKIDKSKMPDTLDETLQRRKMAPMSEQNPTKLGQMNQTVGVPNASTSGGKVQPPPKPTPFAGAALPALATPQEVTMKDKDFQTRDSNKHHTLKEAYEKMDGPPPFNGAMSNGTGQNPTQMNAIQKAAVDITPRQVDNTLKQVQNDILFDMFSYVPDGFGNGINNKLFRMDVNREKIMAEGHNYTPRTYDGPESGLNPLPYEWKNTMSKSEIMDFVRLIAKDEITKQKYDEAIEKKQVPMHSFLEGNDVRRSLSTKGLPTPPTSILQKQIHNLTPFYKPKFKIKHDVRSAFTHLYDPQIAPGTMKNQVTKVRNSLNTMLAQQSTLGNNWME